MSILSGVIIFILILVIVYIISGKAVKPISENYRRQKEFISNASHELKTPITVITATAELMERKSVQTDLQAVLRFSLRKWADL